MKKIFGVFDEFNDIVCQRMSKIRLLRAALTSSKIDRLLEHDDDYLRILLNPKSMSESEWNDLAKKMDRIIDLLK